MIFLVIPSVLSVIVKKGKFHYLRAYKLYSIATYGINIALLVTDNK